MKHPHQFDEENGYSAIMAIEMLQDIIRR